jgi:ABC-2 type transport system ATP-binding protein
MSEIAIRSERLTRHFKTPGDPDRRLIRAVDSLSLEVPAGTIFGFLGPNGAGKTTTIRLLLGLLEPTAGHANVLGYDTRTQPQEIRARTGALLEDSGVYEHLTVEDNLEYYGRIYRLPPPLRQARIQELLEQMGLWERRKDQAGTLSKGMQQKLALARALLHQPSLVLLDEPTAGLDVPSAAAVRDDLTAMVEREGTTVFLTTHNMAEAEKLCSQVAVIREGQLVAVGHPDQLRARSGGPRLEVVGRGFGDQALGLLRAHPRVIAATTQNGHLAIDLRQDAETAPLVSLLVQAGVQVEEVRRGKASLEDVFLTLMQEEKDA